MVLDSKWKDRKRNHVTNADTYGSLQLISTKIQRRRMRLAGHIRKHNELELDCVNEIGELMNNRCLWRTAIDTRILQPP